MSQTLALIVAASVLMMTALTVIFMAQGGLQDTFGSSNQQSCVNTIETTCQFSSSDETHTTPDSCARAGITQGSDLPDSSVVSSLSASEYSCS